MTDKLMKQENLDTKKEMYSEKTVRRDTGKCHVKVDDWRNVLTSQKIPKIAGKSSEARRGA